MLLFNRLDPDPRVFKEAVALSEQHYTIEILAVKRNKFNERKKLTDTAVIHRIFPFSFNLFKHPLKYILNIMILLLYAIKHRNSFDFIHCHDAETLPFGFLLKLFCRNAKIIYDAHEYIRSFYPPASPRLMIPSDLKHRSYIKYESYYINKTDALISVSESIVQLLLSDHHYNKIAICLFNSVTSTAVNDPEYLFRKFNLDQDSRIMIFVGVISPSRGIENIVRILQYMDNSYKLVLLGNWAPTDYRNKIMKLVDELGAGSRVFTSIVSYSDLIPCLSSATVHIYISEPATLSYRFSMPNKLWESIAAGVPFVVNRGFSEISEFIEKHGTGIVVDMNSPEETALKISRFVENRNEYSKVKENIKRAQDIFGWKQEKNKLIMLYNYLRSE